MSSVPFCQRKVVSLLQQQQQEQQPSPLMLNQCWDPPEENKLSTEQ